MSFLGFRFGHFWKASTAASAKSSRAQVPSRFPNLDMPAVTIEASGLPCMCFGLPWNDGGS